MIYLVHDQGTYESRAAYNTEEEALAQAVHDATHGFAIPLRIENEQGRELYSKKKIEDRVNR